MKPTDERSTPPEFFAMLRVRYPFDLDVCATKKNRLIDPWLGPGSWLAEDALDQSVCWSEFGSMAWCNPPYSEIPNWLAKGVGECQSHREFRIVYLLPSNTSARWFHTYIWDQERRFWRAQVRRVDFLEKRLTFGPHETNAMWPSVVVEFGAQLTKVPPLYDRVRKGFWR